MILHKHSRASMAVLALPPVCQSFAILETEEPGGRSVPKFSLCLNFALVQLKWVRGTFERWIRGVLMLKLLTSGSPVIEHIDDQLHMDRLWCHVTSHLEAAG